MAEEQVKGMLVTDVYFNAGIEAAAVHCERLARMNERSTDELAKRGAVQLRAIASEIRGLKRR